MEWYLKVLRQYANFEGRARRKEYWMFTLFNMLFPLAVIILFAAIGAVAGSEFIGGVGTVICLIYMLAIIVPTIAVVVRRLHDTNQSGWMYFVAFIPMIGSIWLLVLMCKEGDRGDNNYGTDPKSEHMEGNF